jgi:hypothetical protein
LNVRFFQEIKLRRIWFWPILCLEVLYHLLFFSFFIRVCRRCCVATSHYIEQSRSWNGNGIRSFLHIRVLETVTVSIKLPWDHLLSVLRRLEEFL